MIILAAKGLLGITVILQSGLIKNINIADALKQPEE